MNNDYNIESNNAWKNIGRTPFVTVVTPVYNREDTILRAMQSVERQSYKDMEYIVVNDGSTDSTEEIIIDFLHKTTMPMLYVKKDNGGVHTARNLGIKLARGEMYMCNDSDDESLPNAVETFVNAWKMIPKEQRNLYFEIKARCINEAGEEVGPRFPEDINIREWVEVKQYYESILAENVGFRRIDIMKANRGRNVYSFHMFARLYFGHFHFTLFIVDSISQKLYINIFLDVHHRNCGFSRCSFGFS